MIDVKDFLQRTVGRLGFTRERFDESKIPKDHDGVCIMPFFGDLRSTFVMSSMLLKRYREEVKGSKYFILLSWPGFQGMFPYVDEYWSVGADYMKKLFLEADGMGNRSDVATLQLRNLYESFRDVGRPEELEPCYDGGITSEFWKKFRHVKRSLPAVPSSAILGKEFNRELATRPGYKVFLFPSLYCRSWRQGRTKEMPAGREFWCELVRRLLKEKYVPVLWRHPLGHDLSAEFTDKCIHIQETDITRVMSAMRAVGLVVDAFNGSSRLALAARCPFLCCDERSRYMAVKEYEVDDLCGQGIPRQYIFSFSTIIDGGNPVVWNHGLLDTLAHRLGEMLPGLDRDSWPPTGESTEIVPYEMVRRRTSKRIGAKLLKIPKE